MKLTLKAKMIFWVWGITAILFSLILYVNFDFDREQVIKALKQRAINIAENYGDIFEEVLLSVSSIPRMNAIWLETGYKNNEDELKSYLKKVVESYPGIYGVCIAFEPYEFGPEKESFAPYYCRRDGKILYTDLGKKKYDYRDKDWYRIPREKNQPFWSDPYYDEGGGNTLMVTYSVPFYRDGKFAGITTVDISLEKMADEIKKIKIRYTGYVFVINKKGEYLTFPDKKKIMKSSVFDFDKNFAGKITSGRSGFINSRDPFLEKDSWIAFYPIKPTNYILGVVHPEEEVMQPIYSLRGKAIFIGSLGLLLLMIVIIFLSRSITTPISNLVKGVKEVAGGDLDYKFYVGSNTYEVVDLETSISKMIENIKEYIKNLNKANKEKEKLFVSSIRSLANAIEARDAYTRGHSERVTAYSVRIARGMNLDKTEIERIRYAALLHDIGKIKIPQDVLNKPGRLTEEEYGVMKEHPVFGAKILEPVEEFGEILPYLYHHHERFDRRGYPDGLGGKDIPLASRILAVADTFDAMTSDRPYRNALPMKIAIQELEKNAGTQLDPEIVQIFVTIINSENDWLERVMKEKWEDFHPRSTGETNSDDENRESENQVSRGV